MVSVNVEISGFRPRKKRGVTPRTDKGKKHNYPVKRAAPYTYCKRRLTKTNDKKFLKKQEKAKSRYIRFIIIPHFKKLPENKRTWLFRFKTS